MFDRTSRQKLFIAAIGIGFMAWETIASTPANAITFNFRGKFFDAIPVEGSYTLDDAIFDEVINSPIGTSADNAVLDFSLFVSGSAPDSSGIYSSKLSHEKRVYDTDEVSVFSLQIVTNNTVENGGPHSPYANLLDLDVKAPDGKALIACKVMECEGWALVGGKGGISGNIFNAPVKSVPEPSAAIGLIILGTLISIGKRKTLHSKSLLKSELQT